MKALLLSIVSLAGAYAGEYAVLATGFRLYVDRHEVQGDKVRLIKGASHTELPSGLVQGFEPDESLPPAPAPAAPAAPPQEPEPAPRQLVEAAAEKYGIDAKLLHSLVTAESGYRPGAVSPKGAVGLMQLMPDTAKTFGADPNNPRENVEAGVAFLAELLRKYQDDPYQLRLALAAYNAGPGAVDRHKGIPPYKETQDYVQRVIGQYRK